MTNPVIDCLLNHRSIRKFVQKPIETEKTDLILEAGVRAATGGNLQLYSFVLIDDPAKKEQLDQAAIHTNFKYAAIPLIIVALLDLHRIRRWFELGGVRSEDICNNRIHRFLLAQWDALIALQNMVVAAESLGLGTCYDGSAPLLDAGEILGAPEHVFPVGMVMVGYPDTTPDLSSRLPMDAVVHRNNYRIPDDDEILMLYAERDKAWERLPADLKETLQSKGINSIAQGVARRKFAAEDYFINEQKGSTLGEAKLNVRITENLVKAGFDLC